MQLLYEHLTVLINGIKWEVADVPKAGQSQVILKGYINKSK